jgi:hypothetical protein
MTSAERLSMRLLYSFKYFRDEAAHGGGNLRIYRSQIDRRFFFQVLQTPVGSRAIYAFKHRGITATVAAAGRSDKSLYRARLKLARMVLAADEEVVS